MHSLLKLMTIEFFIAGSLRISFEYMSFYFRKFEELFDIVIFDYLSVRI